MKHELAAADILPLEAYERVRDEKRRAVARSKSTAALQSALTPRFISRTTTRCGCRCRRCCASKKAARRSWRTSFEAYNPMVPKGNELIATVMLEIDNPVQRGRRWIN